MIYLFLGTDEISKERKLQQLKQEILKNSQDAFDYERLYAKELTPSILNEAFSRIPLFADKRLIFIRDVDKLSASSKEKLLSLIKNPNPKILLVLDTQVSELKEAFLIKIANSSKVFHFGREKTFNAFDLADAIKAKRTQEALKIFSIIHQKGEHPTRILGGLFWSWRKMKSFLKADNFKRGVELFLETDINIKFSRLKPEVALEILIVKLCFLCGG
jgi:DNA polymerase III delta subunit